MEVTVESFHFVTDIYNTELTFFTENRLLTQVQGYYPRSTLHHMESV